MGNEIRRNMALFPMSIVMKLTDLTARQIRYYEQHELISPERTSGKQRIFSLNDIDRLLEIKELMEQGVNLVGIKAIFQLKATEQASKLPAEVMLSERSEHMEQEKQGESPLEQKDLTDQELHQLLKAELFSGHSRERTSMIQGQLSRFFH